MLSSWVSALTDLPLMNRIQQKWWISHPRLGYRKTVVSTLGVCLFFYLLTWKEADCCAVSCPVHRFTWQGTEGAAANSLGTEVLRPLPGRHETLPMPSGRAWEDWSSPQPCGCASWDIWSKRQPNSAWMPRFLIQINWAGECFVSKAATFWCNLLCSNWQLIQLIAVFPILSSCKKHLLPFILCLC